MSRPRLIDQERTRIAELLRDWPPTEVDAVILHSLEQWGERDLVGRIRWRWNPRLRTTIGRAMLEEMVFELNPMLLGRHPQEMRGVVIHELAHLVNTARHGLQVAPHGAQWKQLMREVGESTRATHDLDVEGLRAKPARRRRRVRRRFRLFQALLVVGLDLLPARATTPTVAGGESILHVGAPDPAEATGRVTRIQRSE